MAIVKPFKCIRPKPELANRVAALPYDVYSRKEAIQAVSNEELSFLRIDRAETCFGEDVDIYDDRVYRKAREVLDKMVAGGIFVEDDEECYYLYELTMDGRAQTGIAACSSIDDYLDNVIKKHENTREDKELDRINHVDTCNAQTGPIFLAYRKVPDINRIVEGVKEHPPLYDFTSNDGITHRVWKIAQRERILALKKEFGAIGSLYIADGHHRAASAVKVGLKRRDENPGFDGTEEFNFFLSVLFPDDQLRIMDYNRVVRDLNGYTPEEFLNLLEKDWRLSPLAQRGAVPGPNAITPVRKGEISMLLESRWYKLVAKDHIRRDDPVEGLDVSLLQKTILAPILGIGDPRTDKRIDFVGGIRGLMELERRCSGDMKVAFAMYPTQMEELFSVADAGKLMPPKSTWFEPKLRSGLFIHRL